MKNFIQRETFEFTEFGLEDYCRFSAATFLDTYPQVEGSAGDRRADSVRRLEGGVAFVPAGPDRATARIELTQRGVVRRSQAFAASGCCAWAAARSRDSCATSTRRCPTGPAGRCTCGSISNGRTPGGRGVQRWGRSRRACAAIVMEVFKTFESGSIQQIIHQMGTRILADIPEIAEVRFEANNRTWDVIPERGEELGVYVDPPAPYGVARADTHPMRGESADDARARHGARVARRRGVGRGACRPRQRTLVCRKRDHQRQGRTDARSWRRSPGTGRLRADIPHRRLFPPCGLADRAIRRFSTAWSFASALRIRRRAITFRCCSRRTATARIGARDGCECRARGRSPAAGCSPRTRTSRLHDAHVSVRQHAGGPWRAVRHGWTRPAWPVRVDAAGNLRGVYAGASAGARGCSSARIWIPCPHAGAFDGVLGVVLGVALVESLRQAGDCRSASR